MRTRKPDLRWYCCWPPDSRLWCFLDHVNHVVLQRHCLRWLCEKHDAQIMKECR